MKAVCSKKFAYSCVTVCVRSLFKRVSLKFCLNLCKQFIRESQLEVVSQFMWAVCSRELVWSFSKHGLWEKVIFQCKSILLDNVLFQFIKYSCEKIVIDSFSLWTQLYSLFKRKLMENVDLHLFEEYFLQQCFISVISRTIC